MVFSESLSYILGDLIVDRGSLKATLSTKKLTMVSSLANARAILSSNLSVM